MLKQTSPVHQRTFHSTTLSITTAIYINSSSINRNSYYSFLGYKFHVLITDWESVCSNFILSFQFKRKQKEILISSLINSMYFFLNYFSENQTDITVLFLDIQWTGNIFTVFSSEALVLRFWYIKSINTISFLHKL